jgi:hypothetical protein
MIIREEVMEIVCVDVEEIHFTEQNVQSWTTVNTVINYYIPYKAWNF